MRFKGAGCLKEERGDKVGKRSRVLGGHLPHPQGCSTCSVRNNNNNNNQLHPWERAVEEMVSVGSTQFQLGPGGKGVRHSSWGDLRMQDSLL